ncbi:hypothetical protein [Plantactinospora sp. WMMB782]|uniref:hypothetical protein n=1 Tax=Plantactinospora sp. WMMB782 TaxID=3404121 RepID=UPI003B92DD56
MIDQRARPAIAATIRPPSPVHTGGTAGDRFRAVVRVGAGTRADRRGAAPTYAPSTMGPLP